MWYQLSAMTKASPERANAHKHSRLLTAPDDTLPVRLRQARKSCRQSPFRLPSGMRVGMAGCGLLGQVPTTSVAPGDVLRVLPGERMPVDGLVLAGRSVADEAMLTGEAALVAKGAGDQVRRRCPARHGECSHTTGCQLCT